ncbi:MAG TPA: SIS domain-containing protein [Alphaproteobacteria bacterium]|nr:SIS domain-containing protein [Alphaproteobacteria bacterium]
MNTTLALASCPDHGCADYAARLQAALRDADWGPVAQLADELRDCWSSGRQVFLCGNGGSAGNAIHLANDLLYGISKREGSGLRVHALSANASVLTCLANDEGYDAIFSLQLAVMAQPRDVLVALSGSGNSPNIIRALETAAQIGMRSFAILAYSGGKAKALADVPIHFAVDDMQIGEDLQLVVGHMIMQSLHRNGPMERAGP